MADNSSDGEEGNIEDKSLTVGQVGMSARSTPSATSVTIPSVVAFAYREFAVSANKWSATCKKCRRTLVRTSRSYLSIHEVSEISAYTFMNFSYFTGCV